MTNETEKNPKQEKQQQGPQDSPGSAKASDKNPIPSQQNQNRPQDNSKKNPSQDSDIQHQGQEKPEDGKRRAS